MYPGNIVQHKLQKEWMLVLSLGNIPGSANVIKCRTKKLDVVEFYSFELEPISLNNPKRSNNGRRQK